MSNESVNNNKTSISSVLMFPMMSGTFGALSSIKRNKGVTSALKSVEKESFSNLNSALRELDKDVFTRNEILSQNYKTYVEQAKIASKTKMGLRNYIGNGIKWIKNGFKNLYGSIAGKEVKLSEYATNETLKTASDNAKAAMETTKEALSSANVAKTATGEIESAKIICVSLKRIVGSFCC